MATMSRADRFAATHQKSRVLWERAIKVSCGFHTDPDIEQTIEVFGKAMDGLLEEGVVKSK